ncbi:MAG: hypothetical protein DRP87_13135 [Spirochaetes bacterium]|nr:MAG: hypothetical protein DRP87_13135 [Spirochaetota bacterium]
MLILFIGNSLTFYNFLPLTLRGIIKHIYPCSKFDVGLQVKRYADFKEHWENPDTEKALNSSKWTHVVLQDHSQGPIFTKENFYLFGYRLIEAVRNVGAEPVLFMTWAHYGKSEMMEEVRSIYRDLAHITGASLCPVGEVWYKAKDILDDSEFFKTDGVHPSPLGTLFTAFIFAHFFGYSIKDPFPLDLKIELEDYEDLRNSFDFNGYGIKRRAIHYNLSSHKVACLLRGLQDSSLYNLQVPRRLCF